jgi:disulfide bond formation protein DsbB
MTIPPEIPNTIFSMLTIVGQASILISLAAIIISRVKRKGNRLVGFIGRHAVMLALIVALAATLGSLSYSELVGWEPCRLCWFQRILMYPLAVMLPVALVKKEKKNIADYVIPLCVIGLLISSYHYYIQMFPPLQSVCSATSSESCSTVPSKEFGYITIPLMALTAFMMILIDMLVLKIKTPETKG